MLFQGDILFCQQVYREKLFICASSEQISDQILFLSISIE